MGQFQNKVIWITGASSGIGEAVAKAFNADGATVLISSRREEELERVRLSCPYSEKVYIFPLDLTQSSSIQLVTDEVRSKFEIDILFNNGGISQRSLTSETSIENDRKIFEVNYFGHVQMTKAILPQMLKRKSGHIVTTSSLTGKWGFYLRSAYAASKHALHGFFDSLRMEVEDSGIRVTLITPGFIATEISKHAIDKLGNPSGEMDNNQAKGISSEECARQILAGIVAGKDEFGVGGKELRGLFLHRYFPKLFKKILKRTAAR
ncbi:MAG: SDR family oxidoreductase [Sediminibacterium sp.]